MRQFMMMVLFSLTLSTSLLADGGKVQLSQIVDGRRYTVFTSPTPLRTGIADISLLVQDASTSAVIRNISLNITCQHTETGRTVGGSASHEVSTNRLLQSAKLALPTGGQWQIQITESASESKPLLSFSVRVEDDHFSVPWLTAIIASPLGFIALFLVRERILMQRRSRIRSAGRATKNFCEFITLKNSGCLLPLRSNHPSK